MFRVIGKKKRSTSISISQAAWRKVKREAKRQQRSVSQLVEMWIEQGYAFTVGVAKNGGTDKPSAPAPPAMEEVSP
jgi:hypothetical protein